MQFDAYLTEKALTDAQAAQALDVTDEAIRLWRKGKRLPRREKLAQIEKWSEGKVTATDWYAESGQSEDAA